MGFLDELAPTSGSARCDRHPLLHEPSVARIERMTHAGPRQIFDPIPWQLHDNLSPHEHREDLARDPEPFRPAEPRTRRHCGHRQLRFGDGREQPLRVGRHPVNGGDPEKSEESEDGYITSKVSYTEILAPP